MQVVNLTKKIEGKLILDNISFELYPGKITGLVGRNGVGKTTLFRTMTEIYLKDEGDVFIDQHSIYTNTVLKEKLFYLDDSFNFLNSQTPKQMEIYYQSFYPCFNSEKYYGLLEKYHFDLTKKIHRFSKGNLALFKIILAFSTQSEYYLFDEPFDGLDIIIKKAVIGLLIHEISLNQCGIMISSHNLTELEDLIDHALILNHGKIEKDFDLDNIKQVTKKYQMVFSKKEIPSLVKQNSKIIHVHGRVLIGVFDKMTPELYDSIISLDPVLFEEVPLTLEDIFSVNLIEEKDYSLFN